MEFSLAAADCSRLRTYRCKGSGIVASNIVLILIDDLGWPHLSCYGSEYYESPAIDAVALEGCRFTDFYAAGAVCSPTRASIQSGQYQVRHGITDFIPGHPHPFAKLTVPKVSGELPLEVETLAEALKRQGYTSGYFGKWHLGGVEFEPDKQGYNESIVTKGRHFGFQTSPPKTIDEATYLADYLTDQTVDFIKRNRNQPFFVQLSHFAVHIPLEAKEETIAYFKGKSKPEDMVAHPTYAAMVKHVDESVARVTATLRELNLHENTLLVITSDNGGLRRSANGGAEVSENTPLRNEKGSLYEGGIRVPLIVRWPQVIPSGAVCAEPVISVDFWPTFFEVAGGDLQSVNHPVDGVSLQPVFKDPHANLGREAIFFHYPHYHHSTPASAVRAGDWKLLEFLEDGHIELYNLNDDSSEINNLAENQVEVANRLKRQLADWRDEIGAAMPTPNPNYKPEQAEVIVRPNRLKPRVNRQ
ncbi:MAG: sulfatase [Planctomycetaceae bacterium]|nr:sulfatase [Planctomycetaceae bacterium]